MLSHSRIITLALLTSALGAQTDSGPAPQPSPKKAPPRIEGLDFGKHWFGPKVSHDDIAGKVVMVQYWGS